MHTIERTPIEPKPAMQPAVSVRHHGDGRLIAVLGERKVRVKLRQCFPWSEPSRFVSLRDSDDKEVALIESPATLDGESRRAFELALAEAGFVFDVTRVLDIDEEIEIRQWSVETRQGHRTFQTHLDDWPRVLPSGGLLIRDVAGDLYRVPVPSTLDRNSRALLWAFVD